MTIKIIIEVKVDDDLLGTSEEERIWFENNILVGDGNLILHSNEVGEEIGVVKSVKGIEYIMHEIKP